MSSSALDRLARNIKRTNSTAWSPRSQTSTLHQGTVNAVDVFNGHVDFGLTDPSGLVVPAVRYLQAYSTANPPSVGDVVWAQHFGTDILILGQHVVPANALVIP
jgi:hypothetical protein